eukprot:scaffold323287_cov38-Prasinocladus_malaysianus.AAC.1
MRLRATIDTPMHLDDCCVGGYREQVARGWVTGGLVGDGGDWLGKASVAGGQAGHCCEQHQLASLRP